MSDIYKIAIRIAVTGGAAAAIAALGKELTGVNVKADMLTSKFGKMQMAIAGAFGGVALAGITAFVRKTADLSHELTQIRKLGNQTQDDIRNITSNAIRVTQQVKGINEKQAIDIYGSVYSLVGKRDAMKLMKPLAKFDVFMGNTTGDYDASSGSRDIVRAAEQMGRLTDPITKNVDLNRFGKFLDFATKVAEITHGQVGAKEWLNMAKLGGPAMMGMDNKSLATMAILTQYMGAGRAGTAMMSAMQQFAGGTMFARNAQALQEIGVLKQGEWSTKGGRVILAPEARARLAKEFQQPLEAVIADLVPKLKSHGYDTPDKMIQELFSIFSRQTTQRAFADLIRNEGQIVRELGRIDKAPGLDKALGIANDHDVEQNMKNLAAAWKDLRYAVAGPNSENEIWVLKELTKGVNKFSDTVRGIDPKVLAAIGGGITGLAVALTGAGAMAMLAAIGTGGWFVVGMAALIGLDWAGFGGKFEIFLHSIKSLFNVMQHPLSGWAWQGLNGPNDKFPDATTPGKNKQSTDDNTKALKDLNQTFRQYGLPMSYTGPGISGGGLTNAMYTTGGVSGGLSPARLGAIGSIGGGGGSSILHNGVGSGGGAGGGGPIDTAPVPGGVLAEAAKLAGNPGKLQKFMRDQGFPKSGAWCGEFASAVIRKAGGVPPAGSAVASNWRNYGTPDATAHVGDIAVRNGVPTGSTGSHVGIISKVYPDGSFDLEGGNQGSVITHRHGGFSFRAPPDKVRAALLGTGGGHYAGGSASVNAALVAGAKAAGMDLAHFKAMASIESGLNPSSNMNARTQYKGLFQIGHDEWAKYGHGNIYNAGDNAMAMAGLINAHRAQFRARFGYDPSPDQLYLMHQQGLGFYTNGAMTNIRGNPYPGMHGAQTHSSFERGWAAEVERRANHFANDESPALAGGSGHVTHVHNHIQLDGRTIAKNTTKHMSRMGNMPAHNSRHTDPYGTSSLSI